jgi:hypothetical protein
MVDVNRDKIGGRTDGSDRIVSSSQQLFFPLVNESADLPFRSARIARFRMVTSSPKPLPVFFLKKTCFCLPFDPGCGRGAGVRMAVWVGEYVLLWCNGATLWEVKSQSQRVGCDRQLA